MVELFQNPKGELFMKNVSLVRKEKGEKFVKEMLSWHDEQKRKQKEGENAKK